MQTKSEICFRFMTVLGIFFSSFLFIFTFLWMCTMKTRWRKSKEQKQKTKMPLGAVICFVYQNTELYSTSCAAKLWFHNRYFVFFYTCSCDVRHKGQVDSPSISCTYFIMYTFLWNNENSIAVLAYSYWVSFIFPWNVMWVMRSAEWYFLMVGNVIVFNSSPKIQIYESNIIFFQPDNH